MGSGDLNMKKSWHPALLVNQKKVWEAEKASSEEKKKLQQLRKEREEERQLAELKAMQEAATGRRRVDRLDWMYAAPNADSGALGGGRTEHELEQYLLGKKRVDEVLATGDKQVASQDRDFMAVQNANTPRDTEAKSREDPMEAMKRAEQAQLAALMNRPDIRRQLRAQREGKEGKEDKEERRARKRAEKEERRRERHERREGRYRDERERSPRSEDGRRDDRDRDGRRRRDDRDRSRDRGDRGRDDRHRDDRRRRDDRDRSRDDCHRRDDDRDGRAVRKEDDRERRSERSVSPRRDRDRDARRERSGSPRRDSRRDERRSHDSPRSNGHSNGHANGHGRDHRDDRRDDRDRRDWRDSRDDRDNRDNRPQRPYQASRPPPPANTNPNAKILEEQRAARLAAMSASADALQAERRDKLARRAEEEKRVLEAEERARSRYHKDEVAGMFTKHQEQMGGQVGLAESLQRRGGQGLLRDI